MKNHQFGSFYVKTELTAHCRPRQNISCGACCGIYDFKDNSRTNLDNILKKRTLVYNKLANNLPNNPGKITEIIQEIEEILKKEEQDMEIIDKDKTIVRPCVFLGYTDEEHIGCLLHPLQNSGLDLRYFGAYSQPQCATMVCDLDQKTAQEIAKNSKDWHDYGLAVLKFT
ncbi:MAG: hypothetical protein U9R08_01755 [Nanoarchaeota archaeon]|nr:hypothetical protein [Nanoarchaeota archaeon]